MLFQRSDLVLQLILTLQILNILYPLLHKQSLLLHLYSPLLRAFSRKHPTLCLIFQNFITDDDQRLRLSGIFSQLITELH